MLVANLKILVVSVLCIGYLLADDEVTIEIVDGKIIGRSRSTINGVQFYSFQGIPYAQPPINELRFQAPIPAKPWDDVLNATREGNICYPVTAVRDIDMSEDCLFINVFTPVTPSSDSALPVMFYIYGGGFVGGSSEEKFYGPDFLMEYDVVLVTFNYRVGPFGFFSTGDDNIPGNAGLKDQNLALKWVQKNIANFGGDPKKVTIFGASAGAASVGYHILSPLSAGLFRAAIAESGSPLSAWALQSDIVATTYQTAAHFNEDIANSSTSELLEYLRGLSTLDIALPAYIISMIDMKCEQFKEGCYFGPIIEHKHEGAFLTSSMYESLRKGDFNRVPLLTGFNSEETYFYTLSSFPAVLESMTIPIDEDNERLVPRSMQITSDSNKAQAAQEIKQFYVGDGNFTQDPEKFIKYASDQYYVRSIIKHAALQSAYTNVYFYRFAYKGVLGGYTNVSAEGFSNNVQNEEEIPYIFNYDINGQNSADLTDYPKEDQIVSKRLLTLFTNFAKTLNPTPKADSLLEGIIWPKANATDFAYLDIGSSSEIKYHPRDVSYQKWETIFVRYGVPPYNTY